MHFQITALLAFGAALASTMALPTDGDSALSERETSAWASSWNVSTCAGPFAPGERRHDIPNSIYGCAAFQFTSEYVGVNFGGGYTFPGITFFSDSHCKTVSSLNNWKTVTKGPTGMGCVKTNPGDVVNSVQGAAVVEP